MNTHLPQSDFSVRRKNSAMRTVVFVALTTAAVAVAAQSTNLSAGLDYPSFQIVAERNIFDQSRLPQERAAHPSTRISDTFSLVGTLLYAQGDIAFFDGTSDDYRKALQVGGDIAGFKITAVTLNSVTLSEGTNQTILKVATQMRRDDDGHWSVLAEPIAYSSAENSFSNSGNTSATRSRSHRSARRNSAMITGAIAANGQANSLSTPGTEDASTEMESNPPGTSESSGGASSALERLMQQRAQEEQQLRQGQ